MWPCRTQVIHALSKPGTAACNKGLPGGATGPSSGASNQRSTRPGGGGRRRRATRSALPSTKAAARPRAPCRRPVAAAPHAPSAMMGGAAATAPAAAAPPPNAHIPARRSRFCAPRGARRRMPLCRSLAASRVHGGRCWQGASASSQRRHCTRQTQRRTPILRQDPVRQNRVCTPLQQHCQARTPARCRDDSCGRQRMAVTYTRRRQQWQYH